MSAPIERFVKRALFVLAISLTINCMKAQNANDGAPISTYPSIQKGYFQPTLSKPKFSRDHLFNMLNFSILSQLVSFSNDDSEVYFFAGAAAANIDIFGFRFSNDEYNGRGKFLYKLGRSTSLHLNLGYQFSKSHRVLNEEAPRDSSSSLLIDQFTKRIEGTDYHTFRTSIRLQIRVFHPLNVYFSYGLAPTLERNYLKVDVPRINSDGDLSTLSYRGSSTEFNWGHTFYEAMLFFKLGPRAAWTLGATKYSFDPDYFLSTGVSFSLGSN